MLGKPSMDIPNIGVLSGNSVDWTILDSDIAEYLGTEYNGELETQAILLGDWRMSDNDEWETYAGSLGYSAIYDNDTNVIQVVESKYHWSGNVCSPCYPCQVDLDTPGEYPAKALPPDVMREDWLAENRQHYLFECQSVLQD